MLHERNTKAGLKQPCLSTLEHQTEAMLKSRAQAITHSPKASRCPLEVIKQPGAMLMPMASEQKLQTAHLSTTKHKTFKLLKLLTCCYRHEEVPNKRPRPHADGTAGADRGTAGADRGTAGADSGDHAEPATLMLQDDEVDWENQGQDPALQQALAVIKAKGQTWLRSCILCQGRLWTLFGDRLQNTQIVLQNLTLSCTLL